jgi:hypothetical protein
MSRKSGRYSICFKMRKKWLRKLCNVFKVTFEQAGQTLLEKESGSENL